VLLQPIKNFRFGLQNRIEDKSIPKGASSAGFGWLTKGDKYELSRGRFRLGEEITGTGRVSGLHIARKADDSEVLLMTYARKLRFWDTTIGNPIWKEVGTNFFPADVIASSADGEDMSFTNYSSLAGAQCWISSPNSGLYKIMTANISATSTNTIKDNYDSTKNFKGFIKAIQGAIYLWNRGAPSTKDPTGFYRSYIDKDEVSDYTAVTAEALGSSGATSYSGTLAGISTILTCFGLAVKIGGTVKLVDDFNGNLIHLEGASAGSGTINYNTGAWTVTLTTAASGALTGDYYTENSTSTGVADFTKSGPRTAGQGFVIRQDDGGAIQNLGVYNDIIYALHTHKTWSLQISADDLTATNRVLREKFGVPYWKAMIPTGEGIYGIDDTDETDPKIRLLTLQESSAEVIPISLSDNLTLADYRFDKAAGIEYGNWIVFAFRHKDSTVNNWVLVYDKIWKSFDFFNYYAAHLAVYNGVLMAGDSLSYNVYELFSGLDDDGVVIRNSLELGKDNFDIEALKKLKKLVIKGEIGANQKIKVSVSVDSGAYVEIGGSDSGATPSVHTYAIQGDGSYVDKTQKVGVGNLTLGRGEVGGGSSSAITAYNFERVLNFRQIGLDKFEYIKFKFEAMDIGYASISEILPQDVRTFAARVPSKYR